MILWEAKQLKWGTVLRPSKRQRDMSRRWVLRDAMFLGMTKDGLNMAVIAKGRKTITYWSPIYWQTKPEVRMPE